MGRPIEDLSREELLDVIDHLGREMRSERESHDKIIALRRPVSMPYMQAEPQPADPDYEDCLACAKGYMEDQLALQATDRR